MLLLFLIIQTYTGSPRSEAMDDVVTIFFQGNNAARTQACKYAGPKGLDIVVTGNQVEHVFIPEAPELLHNIYMYDELNDIQYGTSWNPLHWLFSAAHCLNHWRFNVYGTSCFPHNQWSLMNLAGPEDVTQYLNAIRDCIKKYPEKKIVLFGTSRGASVVMVTLSMLSLEEQSHIKLAIAEAPFATVQSVLENTYPKSLVPLMLNGLEKATMFQRDQYSPLESVQSGRFAISVPLLIVTSKVDNIVPPKETQQLIDILRERHLSLHLLELEHSHHSFMSLQNRDDIQKYEDKLASLYKEFL